MAIYLWEGRTRQGTIKKGEMEAANEAVARSFLRKEGIIPLKITAKPKDIAESLPFLKPKVKGKDVVVFTRQLATMIASGLPLLQALEILSSQQENKTFKKVISEVKLDVETGSTFADGLKKHPKVFDELFVNLVAAGEVAGMLDTVLNRLAAYTEKAMKLKSKVKGAMTYPIIVLVVAIGVVSILLVFVIPMFQKMFAEMGGTMPAFTQMVINLSEFTQKNIIWAIVGVIFLVFAFRRFHASKGGRVFIDDLVLKLPVLGEVIRKVAVAKFTRTLGTMLASGVSILDGLDIVAKGSGNKTIEKSLLETKKRISEGKNMAEPLAESGVFPPMVVQMIAVGESTGALDQMLGKIADFYDDEVDTAVEALTSMIEPMMMVFLGGTIGGLVVAMYLPIFKMAAVIG